MAEHLGRIEFLETPTVNGQDLIINAGGVPSISSGNLAARPAAGIEGRLYLDITTNTWYRDNGTSWDNVSQIPTNVDGVANQTVVTDGQPTIVGLADNVVLPGLQGVKLPAGATADRNGSPAAGTIRFNTTTSLYEGYYSTEWMPFGEVLQVVNTTIPAATFTGSQIPLDSTVPTSTEGAQFFTTVFTPVSANSRICVDFDLTVATTTASRTIIVSVFRGTTIVGSSVAHGQTQNVGYSLKFSGVFQPGSTAPITISGRCGLSGSGNTIINQAGSNTLGGTLVTQCRITEIKA